MGSEYFQADWWSQRFEFTSLIYLVSTNKKTTPEWNQSGWQPKHCNIIQVSSFDQTVFTSSREIWRYVVYKYTFRQIHHITAIRSNTPIGQCSIFFPLNNPSVTSDLQSVHSLIISPSEMASQLTSQTDWAHSPCKSAVNHSGAYFSTFKNSQKIEEKSYDYYFFTNVIRTKRNLFGGWEKI